MSQFLGQEVAPSTPGPTPHTWDSDYCSQDTGSDGTHLTASPVTAKPAEVPAYGATAQPPWIKVGNNGSWAGHARSPRDLLPRRLQQRQARAEWGSSTASLYVVYPKHLICWKVSMLKSWNPTINTTICRHKSAECQAKRLAKAASWLPIQSQLLGHTCHQPRPASLPMGN